MLNELNFIFNFIEEHQINSEYIQQQFKIEFFQKLKGLIFIDEYYKYNIISQDNFINDWEFAGITRGNRLKFKPKYL